MRVCSFRALHPRPDLARDVSSPPWDTVTLEEARAMVRAQPLSFLRVVRAEADLPEGVDMHSETVYRHAAEALQELRSEGKLVRDTEAYFYVYRQRKGDHEQAGVVARCHVGEYEGGRVRRHERVLAGKVWDRARLIRALGAHPGLVFLMFRDRDDVAREIGEACRNEPLMDFEAEDGVQHTVWKVSGAGSMQAALSAIPCAYIADGHHRAAAAVEAAKRPGGRGAAAACPWFPVVLFPAGNLRVLGYHRGVRELNGHTPASFLAEVRQRFRVEPCERPGETAAGRVHLYLAGRWHAVHLAGAGTDVDAAAAAAAAAGEPSPPAMLDAQVLQDRLLEPVLGIGDPTRDERLEFVGGVHGYPRLQAGVDAGEWMAAFVMHPVSTDQLMAVSDAGAVMPPKSTWFEPKLRSGLLVHLLEP